MFIRKSFFESKIESIENILKYTNHSKRKDKLLREKKIYEAIINHRTY